MVRARIWKAMSPTRATAKFVIGPATATMAMSRRGLLQVVGVHGDGLGPPEARHDEGQRAERIDVRQRIQRDAPLKPRRRIAEAIGDEGVRQLVQGHGDQERRNLKNEALEEGGGIAPRRSPISSGRRRARRQPTPRRASGPGMR